MLDAHTQRLMMGAAGAGKKTYVEDVFSPYVYYGTGSAGNQVNNGVDVSGEGGMVWIKPRAAGYHYVVDSERNNGAAILNPNTTDASANNGNLVSSLNNNGFTLGSLANANTNGDKYASWTWRKAPGFFDIITYTGNGSNRTISHNLGTIPGMILVKKTSSTSPWTVYHKSMPASQNLTLNTQGLADNSTDWNSTAPTASVFSLGNTSDVNGNGDEFVAYLFAGGESTAATARSVLFDGTGDYLSPISSSDFTLGTGDFTIECWVKPENINDKGVWQISSTGLSSSEQECMVWTNSNDWKFRVDGTTYEHGTRPAIGQWTHIAWVKHNSKSRLYVNGTASKNNVTDTHNYTGDTLAIGGYYSTSYLTNGFISNFRLVKGTAVYTSSFRPPTEPLTNITNTKILCCNNSSTTGSTVTPGTITANGDPTASASSPFDDPEGYKFGKDGDQNVIECDSYIGNGSATLSTPGPEINLGWEPQWILLKNASSSSTDWYIYDSIRGIVTGAPSDVSLSPNNNDSEKNETDWIELTSTGFKIKTSSSEINQNGYQISYTAIRRPDGYVSKPALVGTDSFAMDTGNGSSIIPVFDSGFPVDFTVSRKPASAVDWAASARLMGPDYLATNSTRSELEQDAVFLWDSNVGCYSHSSFDSTQMGWMWKRGVGFEVVNWSGTGNANTVIQHGLSKTPEMIWLKNRSRTCDWIVYHMGLNGGVTPEQYYLALNSSNAESTTDFWQDTAPTSTAITVGSHDDVNSYYNKIIAMLFTSVAGISKCGNYLGDTSDNPLDLGFTPRFLMIKRVDAAGDWYIFDTFRGIASAISGNAEQIYTHEESTQQTYSWTCPAGVTSVSVVAVGAGGGGIGAGNGQNYGIGGGGGGLGYKNNISVTAGQSYTVKVGAKGQAGPSGGGPTPTGPAPNDGDSYFIDASTVRGGGGEGGYSSSNGGRGGDYTGDGGGNGGRGGPSVNSGGNKGGGGGAGGYAGNGGDGMNAGGNGGTGTDGSGGAGGGSFGGGGGVGLNGQGDSGNFSWNNGAGGSGGDVGGGYAQGGWGGNYGGGGGCVDNSMSQGSLGGQGAVRIIWNTGGQSRTFPSTNVGPPVDKVLKLNTSDSQFDQDCLSTTASGVTLTGADSLVNVNGGKYIYYAHA